MPHPHAPLLLALVAVLLPLSALAVEIGDRAPQITMGKQLTGERVDPSVVDGKTVYMVVIWSTTCHSSARAVPILANLCERLAEQDFRLVGFSMQDEAATAAFIEKYEVPYSSFLDEHDACSQYIGDGGIDTPMAFIIDREGTVVWRGAALDGIDSIIAMTLAGDLAPANARAIQAARKALYRASISRDLEAVAVAQDALYAVEPGNPRVYSTRATLIQRKVLDMDYTDNLRTWLENCRNHPEGLVTLMASAGAAVGEEALYIAIEAGERVLELTPGQYQYPEIEEKLALLYREAEKVKARKK